MANDYEIGYFDSSIRELLPNSMKNMFSLKEKLFLLLRAVKGYRIVYIENSEKQLCCWCFLKKDYLQKYPFLGKSDVLINPYYTVPKFRGQGFAKRIIKEVTDIREYNNIFALVKEDNLPSIAVLEYCGFERIGWSGKSLWSHTVSPSKGSIIIFRYKQV